MRPIAVVPVDVLADVGPRFAHAGVGPQVHPLVFDRAPDPLDEHVIPPGAAAVHGELGARVLDRIDKVLGGELAALVGVDMTFPKAHWTQIYSTNPLERLNAEIKRRTNVVGIFPNDASITRLVGAMMLEQNDEWALNRRYMQQYFPIQV
jgi:hypothetical protein